MKPTLKILSVAFALLTLSSHAFAQKDLSFFGYEGEPYGPKSPAFTFSAGLGAYHFGTYSNFSAAPNDSATSRIKNRLQYSLRMGYAFSPHFEAEGLFSFSPTLNQTPAGVSQNVWVYHYGLNLIAQYPGRITPYLIVGAGGMSFDRATQVQVLTKFTVNYGGGLKFFMGRNLALRPEVFGSTSFENTDHALHTNLLLTYYMGRHPFVATIQDRDKDGIIDSKDQCPDQPETYNQFQDEDGCPDELPAKKPDTLADRDGDGIPDFNDKCPDQPETKNEFQDEDGCPDEVPAVKVAPKDTDGDGIFDSEDKCVTEPETKNGYQDEDGCPDKLPQDLAVFTGPIEGIFFEVDSAIIKEESYPVLEDAASIFKKYNDVRVLIEGHTDSTASDAYNLKLSKERAHSVKEYLLSRGIAVERIIVNGLGESKPIATNKTAAGRAKNRRIEFKLIGKHRKN